MFGFRQIDFDMHDKVVVTISPLLRHGVTL